MQDIEINDKFSYSLDLIENSNKSLFITGKAGTGKSTLLDHFSKITKKSPVILAPTGIAAINVKGQTIHNFFRFYVDVTPEKIHNLDVRPRDIKIYRNLKTIIIDEVSMVRADLLDCIDAFLSLYGPKIGEPFGGVQMVFVGDLYQLPPVVQRDEGEIFTSHYETPYFFSAHVLKNFELEIIELEKIYRQKDQDFVKLLNRIRNNAVDNKDIDQLNTRLLTHNKKEENKFYISLTTTNKKADEINDSHLNALNGKMVSFPAIINGDFAKEYFPTGRDLQAKVGAQIMMLNNDPKKRWVNGTIGVIKAIKTNDEDEPYIKVTLENDDSWVNVYPHEWELFQFSFNGKAIVSKQIGTFTQFPFRLAWAVTIHKSQGKTFDHVIVDIGSGTFASGQLYVALSRCTSFSGILLQTPIAKHHIRTDHRIVKYLKKNQPNKTPNSLTLEEKIAMIQQAIKENAKLTITYIKADDSTSEQTVTPITIGNRTYLGQPYPGMRAFSFTIQETKMFHVDRILMLKKVD